MIIDLHTHTYPTSDDSRLTPDELISEAKRIGLDGICITDHDGFWKPKDIEKLADKYKFTVLPGCEVTTEEGHLLVYGLKKYIFGWQNGDDPSTSFRYFSTHIYSLLADSVSRI